MEGGSISKILTGKHTGSPKRRWEENITMDLKETCINTRHWVDSDQDSNYWRALVNAALMLRIPNKPSTLILLLLFMLMKCKNTVNMDGTSEL